MIWSKKYLLLELKTKEMMFLKGSFDNIYIKTHMYLKKVLILNFHNIFTEPKKKGSAIVTKPHNITTVSCHNSVSL